MPYASNASFELSSYVTTDRKIWRPDPVAGPKAASGRRRRASSLGSRPGNSRSRL